MGKQENRTANGGEPLHAEVPGVGVESAQVKTWPAETRDNIETLVRRSVQDATTGGQD
jgi:hypothetical protein